MVCCERNVGFYFLTRKEYLGNAQTQSCFQLTEILGAPSLFEQKHDLNHKEAWKGYVLQNNNCLCSLIYYRLSDMWYPRKTAQIWSIFPEFLSSLFLLIPPQNKTLNYVCGLTP
uniref:Uncharacterized protein n=1 Tax=Sphaerodactylus townsendi TaxID=933632 RepID=A0ACB8FEJ3_9SAUR